jgi:hypothetical protein
MNRILVILGAFLIFPLAVFAQTKNIESVYTSLSDKVCKAIKSNPNEGGDYRGMCPGVGGYKLELLEGDLRQTINVIAPNRKSYPLDLWSVVTPQFSAVGEKAEWRVIKSGKTVTPKALIFRYNASKGSDRPEQTDSFLVIVKITNKTACVTDVVEPSVKYQNIVARQLADASAIKPCKSTD